MRSKRFHFITLALILLLGSPIRAQEKPPFLVDAWTTENGLPQNTILSIAQSGDGYLWVATFNGLARFDGVRFTVFDPLNTPELKSARIIDLQPDGHGGIWIFSEEGYFTHLLNGKFEALNGRRGLPDSRFGCVSADFDGNVWLHDQRDVSRHYRSTGLNFVPAEIKVDVTTEDLKTAAMSRRGFWTQTSEGWRRLDDNNFRAVAGEVGVTKSLSPSRDGDIWGIFPDKVKKLRSGEERKLQGGPWNFDEPTHLLEDDDGNILVATWRTGLSIITPENKVYPLPLIGGAIARSVRFLFIDREKNCWVGTDIAGLQRIKARTFKTYRTEDGLSGDIIRSIDASPNGRLWIVTRDGIDWSTREGEFNNFLRDSHDWWAWSHAPNGDAWSGAYGGKAARVSASGYEAVPTSVHSVRVVAPHHAEGVWIGGYGGFGHTVGNQFTPVDLPSELTNPFVRAVVDAGPNELWVGIYEGGVFRRDTNGWHRFGRSEGLKDDQVISLYRDADGVIWVGASFGGLNRLKDGKFTNFQDAIPSMPSRVSAVIEDDLEYLWLASLNGIHRVSRRELNDLADGKAPTAFLRLFTRADGLESTECSESRQPTATKTADGKLWFATINGLSVIDPKNLPASPLVPSVAIEEIVVDGKTVSARTQAADEKRSLTLKAGSSHVEIHYTALTLQAAEKARFKYRMLGLDGEWVDADARRVAYFNKLPPNDYVFQVTAANSAGIWNEHGESMTLRMEPFVWQTWWFKSALGLVVGAAVLTAFRLRIAAIDRERGLQEEFSRKLIESQEHERSRIARELHDGLGQDLLVIKNYAVLGLAVEPKSANAGHYHTISETASEAIRQVREISHDLRPYQLEHLGPTSAIRGIYKRLSEGPIRFEALVENIDALFSKEDASHVFRILQELTNNILKHSHATESNVIVEKRGDHVHIEVTDNGLGFEGAVKGSGLGLRGIAERVRILGGSVTMTSGARGGTRVDILLPIRR